MSLINSLFAGVSGLRNHQSMMDVIGNNIANVNTIGYKGSRVTFSDTFNQFVRFGNNPTDLSGGTNTFQIGLGMKLNSVDRNWNQGTFERTGIVTDLALQGSGLFILENNGERFYSRAGSFVFDADGKLVNPQNGAIVQGKVATSEGVIPPGNNLEDISIDTNLRLPAVATTNATWGGNLDSTASITRSEEYVQSGNINSAIAVGDSVTDSNTIYDSNGNEYTLSVTYTKTAADEYDMTYELTDADGNVVADNGATALAVVFDNTTGDVATVNGAAAAAINIVEPTLGIDFNFDMTEITQTSNSTTVSSTVDDNRDATIVTGTVSIFDSLGNSHTLTVKFTKTSSNNWNWTADIPNSSGTLSQNSGTISFNSDGSVDSISPNPPVVTFAPTGGAQAENITLTDPNMTRFMMSLPQSVDLVLHAFLYGQQGDLFVRKSPACTIETLARAIKDIFNSKSKISYIGTRHGEKIYETLVSREEMSKAVSTENYFKIPMDNRSLNYESFFSEGSKSINNYDDYTSHNTQRLDIEETKTILKELDYIREKLCLK